MTPDQLREEISKLDAGDKLRLVADIWNSLPAQHTSAADVPDGIRNPGTGYQVGATLEVRDDSNPAKLDRITQRPEVMGGRACIRNMRVTVGMLVNQLAAGRDVEQILADFPYLEAEDVRQALRYAAWRAEEREVILAGP